MSSATVAATDNRTRCDAIRHWLTPHRLHCIVLAAYVIVVGTVMCFHEPWFDEAQAWLIARDCSWREMILERPHYEHHPPLWWMMLAAPAKLGVPYEIGLKSINLACATLMIWLLEFKTKLPEPFKVILPFSYFLCYQYGVTSRPYALMVAAMLLVAINWKTRDEKPWREALSMMLLCLTSSYGLVIAGMFAANWVVRFVWQEHSLIRNRRRFIALLALLAAAMAILIDVMPAKDVYSGNFDISGMTQPAPLWMQICNSWLLLPAEALFTSTVSDTNLVFIGLSSTLLYTGTVSCLMWAPLIHISRRRHNAMLLLSSYTVMCLVFAQHFSMHHLGILLGFFIAVLAIDCDERRISTDDWPAWCITMADRFIGKLGARKARNYLITLKALALGAMLISVYWTINASICDIRYEYSSSRTVASFIKTNHLEQYRWMAGWTRINSTNASPDVKERINQGGYCADGKDCIDYTSWVSGTLVTADPYFKRTLMSSAYKGRSYISWEWCIDPYAGKQDIETWRSWGEPEFYDTIYQPFFFSALGYDRNDYTKIRIAETVTPWKDQRSRGSVEIYVRNDIYKNVLHSPDTGIAWPDGAKRR